MGKLQARTEMRNLCYTSGMKKALIVCAVALSLLRGGSAAPAALLIPAREWAMIRQVAVNYDLSEDATWLLAAIRRHENGRPGLEFGVGGPMNSGHPAHRYQDGTKSFYIQAMWAAGTIRKHYKGDLVSFGKRYNPPHAAKWTSAITSMIARLKIENNYRLPGVRPAKKEIRYP